MLDRKFRSKDGRTRNRQSVNDQRQVPGTTCSSYRWIVSLILTIVPRTWTTLAQPHVFNIVGPSMCNDRSPTISYSVLVGLPTNVPSNFFKSVHKKFPVCNILPALIYI